MGVIKPIPDDANIAMVYVTPSGIIVSVGRGFNNLFGHNIAEHIGKPLRSICKNPEEFNKLLSSAVASTSASGLVRAASSVDGQDFGNLTIMHKYGDEITVHVKIMKVSVFIFRPYDVVLFLGSLLIHEVQSLPGCFGSLCESCLSLFACQPCGLLRVHCLGELTAPLQFSVLKHRLEPAVCFICSRASWNVGIVCDQQLSCACRRG